MTDVRSHEYAYGIGDIPMWNLYSCTLTYEEDGLYYAWLDKDWQEPGSEEYSFQVLPGPMPA